MIKKLNELTFNEVYEHNGPVVVAFSATWCAPCRAYQPALEKLAETGVKVVKVDVTESPNLSAHFAIATVPTTVLFAGGEPKLVVNGVKSVETLLELISEAVNDKETERTTDRTISLWTKLKNMFSVIVPYRV